MKKTYTMKEATAALHLSARTVTRLIKANALKATKGPGGYKIDEDSLISLIQAGKTPAGYSTSVK